MTVEFVTLGCRLNRAESDGLATQFSSLGFTVAGRGVVDSPDLIVLQSCTVTDQADRTTIQTIAQLRRRHPQARIVVTGCMAQTSAGRLRDRFGDELFLVVGNLEKSKLAAIVAERWQSAFAGQGSASVAQKAASANSLSSVEAADRSFTVQNPFDYQALPRRHVRAFLKIQEGCNRRCSYCKVPAARGRAISRPLESILSEISRLEEHGIAEIVLTGVNIGCYREPQSQLRFVSLVERLLAHLSSARLRISSLEPCDTSRHLGELLHHPQLCTSLHLPLQSGSPAILRTMRRPYRRDTIERRLEELLNAAPSETTLGTDIIVGFPGESESDFSETINILDKFRFTTIHRFPFSVRQNTEAATLAERYPVEHSVINERMAALLESEERHFTHYLESRIGSTSELIAEWPDRRCRQSGLGSEGLRIYLPEGQSVEPGRRVVLTIGGRFVGRARAVAGSISSISSRDSGVILDSI